MSSWIIGERRPGSCSVSTSGDKKFAFKMTVEFLIQADDKFHTREQILFGTPGLPRVGRFYGPLFAKCTEVTVTRTEEATAIWVASCSFDTSENDTQKDSQNNPGSDDPTDWIPTFKIDGFTTKQESITEDFTPAAAGGPKKLANSAGQPFEPFYTASTTLVQFSGFQFETDQTTLKEISDRHDRVNNGSVDFGPGLGVFPARTLLLELKGAEIGFYYGYRCWRVDYQFTYDPDKYDITVLDIGTCYLQNVGGQLKQTPYKDRTETQVITGPLNGSGGKVLDANQNPDMANAFKLQFRIKQEIDFTRFLRLI